MSQVAPPVPSGKVALLFTLGTAAVIGVAIVIANRKKNEPEQSTKKHGYTVQGHNYSKCNCN